MQHSKRDNCPTLLHTSQTHLELRGLLDMLACAPGQEKVMTTEAWKPGHVTRGQGGWSGVFSAQGLQDWGLEKGGFLPTRK